MTSEQTPTTRGQTPRCGGRVVLVGWGAIGQTVGRMLTEGGQAIDGDIGPGGAGISHGHDADADGIEIVGVAVRDPNVARDGIPAGARVISDPAELAALQPDVVAEAAGRDSVAAWGHAALSCGADFIVSSMSAFADPEVLESLRLAAAENHAQLHIQPGALAGVDALSGARRMGIDAVEHRMVKPPNAWLGTPAEDLCDLGAITEAVAFYSATAATTAAAFPKNANVAMTTALAGVGPEQTQITLVADPNATTNRHEISAHGPFGSLDVSIANNPLPDNPKTSAMAALNLVRALENRTAAIVI